MDECRGVIVAAEEGRARIVTSSLTLVEVIKLKKHPPLARDREHMISEFFLHDYIVVRQLDRFLAEQARRLVWYEGIDPKDAVHVATALRAKVEQLDTFDKGLIKKAGTLGDPPLAIGHPNIAEQLSFSPQDQGKLG